MIFKRKLQTFTYKLSIYTKNGRLSFCFPLLLFLLLKCFCIKLEQSSIFSIVICIIIMWVFFLFVLFYFLFFTKGIQNDVVIFHLICVVYAVFIKSGFKLFSILLWEYFVDILQTFILFLFVFFIFLHTSKYMYKLKRS